MSRTNNNNNNGSQMIRNLVEKAEAYNRSLFSNNASMSVNKKPADDIDDVTNQILFCQNGIDSLNVSLRNSNSTLVSQG
jgi:hypothetical protein